jgi:pyrroloquinoline quinone biosynthesis protein D
MKPGLDATPRLAPGVRLNESTRQPRILLLPERVLRLNRSSLEIILRCDGKNTVRKIAEELHQLYSTAELQRVTDDIVEYLALLQTQRAIDF